MVKHYIPNSLQETLELLNTHDLEIIAGGTDLMVQRRTWADTSPKFKSTINIINLEELKYIKKESNEIHIGSTTSLTNILHNEHTPELLKESIKIIASPALRNIATIAGNIGNASPAADTVPILYLLNAKIVITHLNGDRIIRIEDVILGPRKTILQHNEIITEIIIPLEKFTKTSFVKVGGRKADAISKISFSAAASLNNEFIEDIRFVFGAVGPTMVRSKELEQQLHHKTKEQVIDMLPQIIDDYSEIIKPIDDQRSNKEYRKHVALNLLQDFLLSL